MANVLLGNIETNVQPMTDQHSDKLRDNRDEVCSCLNPDVDLLTQLESHDVLTSSDVDRIRSKQTAWEMSHELLRILARKPDSAFDSFITGLNNTKQSHVAYILTGVGERPIGKYKIEILNRNRCVLVDNLEPIHSGLLDDLLTQGVLTEVEYQMVREERSRYEQSICLVNTLKRKWDSAFDCFVETLKKTEQCHLAKQIIVLDISGTVSLSGSFTGTEMPELEQNIVRDMQDQELLPSLQNDGIYSKIEYGGINIRFSCTSADSVTKLRQLYESGDIDRLLYESHGCKFSERGVQSLKVNIPMGKFHDVQSCTIMTPEHRSRLQSAADKVATRLTVSEQLLSKLSLCRRRGEAILAQPTAEESSRCLFDIVSQKTVYIRYS